MEVCILQPLSWILQQIIVQTRVQKRMGLQWGLDLGVSQPGDHICLHRKLQTRLLPPPAVYSLFILYNEQPKASLSCWRRGCLQEEQAVNWAAPQQSVFPSRWPAACLQPSGCQENCDKANVRSCGAFWMFLTPSICFPAWVWQRSCVGLIGCLPSPGRG